MTDAVRCLICRSEAAEIDLGLFDGAGFDCKFHGRFRVSGTVLAQRKKRTRRQWEHNADASQGAGIRGATADQLEIAVARGRSGSTSILAVLCGLM